MLWDKPYKSDLLLFCHHTVDSFNRSKHTFACSASDSLSQNSWYSSAGNLWSWCHRSQNSHFISIYLTLERGTVLVCTDLHARAGSRPVFGLKLCHNYFPERIILWQLWLIPTPSDFVCSCSVFTKATSYFVTVFHIFKQKPLCPYSKKK